MTQLPPAFLERLGRQLGDELPAFLAALDEPSPVSLRLNTRKPAPLTLSACGNVPWCAEGIYLSERPIYTLDPFHHAGAYYVQEASSMLVAHAMRQCVDLSQSLRVLDLCASPGGKATLLANLLNNDSLLVANEAIRGRVPVLRENLTRWGWPNVCIANRDPADFVPLTSFFDVVVVDAPCSGEGLFRKDPDASREWSTESAERCQLRQRRILSEAGALVRPGGLLLYSTCTFNTDENDGVVGHFLESAGGYHGVEMDLPPEWGVSKTRYGWQCWPHRVRGEGFYLATLRKDGVSEVGATSASSPTPLPPLPEEVRKWLQKPDDFGAFVRRDGNLFAVPRNLASDVDRIYRGLGASPLLSPGQHKGKAFVPDHSLALSSALSAELTRLELDRASALRYLKKEPFDLPEGTLPGWTIATYGRLALGWLKVLPDRYNNYLPNEWRIRMALPPGL